MRIAAQKRATRKKWPVLARVSGSWQANGKPSFAFLSGFGLGRICFRANRGGKMLSGSAIFSHKGVIVWRKTFKLRAIVFRAKATSKCQTQWYLHARTIVSRSRTAVSIALVWERRIKLNTDGEGGKRLNPAPGIFSYLMPRQTPIPGMTGYGGKTFIVGPGPQKVEIRLRVRSNIIPRRTLSRCFYEHFSFVISLAYRSQICRVPGATHSVRTCRVFVAASWNALCGGVEHSEKPDGANTWIMRQSARPVPEGRPWIPV